MQSNLIVRLRTVFVGFILFFSTAPLIPLLRRANLETKQVTDPGQSDPLMQFIWLGIYLGIFLFFLLDHKKILFALTKDRSLILLVSLAASSVLWSAAPKVTLVRSVAMIFTMLIGAYIGTFYSVKDQLKLLAWVLGIAAVLSLLFVIVPPNYGITNLGGNAGAWRGIYHQKNVLGRYMSLAVVVFLFIALDSRRYKRILWGLFFSTLALLVFSDSKNALVTTVTVILLIPFLKTLKLDYVLRTALIIASILLGGSAIILLLLNMESFLGLLGKDPTLTGRTDLWSVLFEYIKHNPILGYGYSGFWGANAAEVWGNLTWKPRHAHNGFIQIVLDLGILGLLIFLVHFMKVSLLSVTQIRLTKQVIGLWPLTFLVFSFFSNLAECTILDRNNILWILYVSTTVAMVLERHRAKYGKASSSLSSFHFKETS